MPVPSRLLNDGEVVALDVRPHWWSLAGPIVLCVAVVAGAIVTAVAAPPAPVAWVVLAVLAVVLLRLLVRYARWRATSLVVTDRRLIRRSGVLSRSGREIPLPALTDVSYHQGLFERVIGAGDLMIESAGHDGAEVFVALPRPAAIQREIDRLRVAQARASGGGMSLPEQLDRLDDLRRRGVVSDDEFARTKRRWLEGR